MKEFHIPENIAISDSGFLFVPSTGESFTLNSIGKEILLDIKSKKTLDEIKEKILENYDIDPVSFDRDLIDFLNQLKNFGIIKQL